MNKYIFTLSIAAAMTLSGVSTAAVPDGYYNSLEGLSGVALKKAVKALVSSHKVIHYGDATEGNAFAPAEIGTWTVFGESDVRTIDGHLCWWDMYSANNVWVSDGHPGLNIEHSVANSWWGAQSGSKEAYNDLHHLNPSNGTANGQKSNWPLGEIQGSAYWTNGVTTTGTPKAGMGDGATRVFEPHDVYKGDFARAYFYIFTIYDNIPWKDENAWMYNTASDLTLKDWAVEMMLKWADTDKVSKKELERNDAVYKHQENRNPFIDCPQLAQHIWGSKKNEPFHYQLYTAPADEPDYPGFDEEFSEMKSGQWVPVSSADELREDYEYYLVSPTKNRAMTYTLISTGKAIDECAFSPLHKLVTYPDVITGVPEDIATVKLEKAGDFWYVAVYKPDGEFVGYINVKAKSNAIFSSTKLETCKAKITVMPDQGKTVMTYTLSDGDYNLQYNSGNPRFAAYSSNQNPIQLYRLSDEELSDPENDNNGVGEIWSDANGDETITAIYDINGRRVNSTSTVGLEKGIYIVITNFGTKKIRK